MTLFLSILFYLIENFKSKVCFLCYIRENCINCKYVICIVLKTRSVHNGKVIHSRLYFVNILVSIRLYKNAANQCSSRNKK